MEIEVENIQFKATKHTHKIPRHKFDILNPSYVT